MPHRPYIHGLKQIFDPTFHRATRSARAASAIQTDDTASDWGTIRLWAATTELTNPSSVTFERIRDRNYTVASNNQLGFGTFLAPVGDNEIIQCGGTISLVAAGGNNLGNVEVLPVLGRKTTPSVVTNVANIIDNWIVLDTGVYHQHGDRLYATCKSSLVVHDLNTGGFSENPIGFGFNIRNLGSSSASVHGRIDLWFWRYDEDLTVREPSK